MINNDTTQRLGVHVISTIEGGRVVVEYNPTQAQLRAEELLYRKLEPLGIKIRSNV
jgi:hypothetical protein